MIIISEVKSAEYELGDIKQPQYHSYISRDTVGQFKIRTKKYVMNANENKSKDAWCGAKSAISGAHGKDPPIFRCLLNLWKTKFSKRYKKVCNG